MAEGHARHSRHLLHIAVSPDGMFTGDEVLERMTSRKIFIGVHYRGVHEQCYYRERYPLRLEAFTAFLAPTVRLSLSPQEYEDDQDDLVEALAEAVGSAPRA